MPTLPHHIKVHAACEFHLGPPPYGLKCDESDSDQDQSWASINTYGVNEL